MLPLAIAALIALPLLMTGVAALFVTRNELESRRAVEAQLTSATGVVASRIQQLVAGDRQLLAQYDAGLGPDPEKFSAGAAGLRAAIVPAGSAAAGGARATNALVLLFDAAGKLGLNGAAGRGTSIADRDYFKTLAGGAPEVITPLITQSAFGYPVFGVARRLERSGKFAGAAIIFVNADVLSDSWNTLELGPDSTLVLVRDDGWLVTRHPLPPEGMNIANRELFTEQLPKAASGVYNIPASPIDNEPRVVGYRRITGLPLIAVASRSSRQAAAAFQGRMIDDFLLLSPFGLALVTVCIWMGALLVAQERSRTALAATVAQNRMLLQEIHHRVKNNMQAVVSLVRLQPGPPEQKEELAQRIAAMTAIHQQMYESDEFAAVASDEYLGRLLKSLQAGMGTNVRLQPDIQRVLLTPEQALPLGLIVNEIASNAVKHAFPDQRPGVVKVSFKEVSLGVAELTVADNGVGFDITKSASMGTRLIRGLCAQLGGEPVFDFNDGTSIRLRFPLERPKAV